MPARRTPQKKAPTVRDGRTSTSISDDNSDLHDEEGEEEEEEDEEGDDDEGGGDDRGDDVDGDDEEEEDDDGEDGDDDEEEDPDGDDEEEADDEEDEEEEEDEDDPDALADIANEGMVPIGRLNQVLDQNRQLLEAVLAQNGGKKAADGNEAPAFDMAAKIRARNKALVDGDEDAAADIDLEIEAERTRLARERATEDIAAALTQQSVKASVKAVRTTFPELDPGNKKRFNGDTNDMVSAVATMLERKGMATADAIVEAARRVCDPTGERSGGGGDRGTKAGKKTAQATRDKVRNGGDGRTQRQKMADLKRARRMPPNSARAGVPNRNSVDADDDPDDTSSMTEGRVRKMSPEEKRIARGDYVGSSPRRKQRGR